MTKQIKCKTKINAEIEQVRIKVIKAPLVDTLQLRNIIYQRTRAVVL